jgi:bifunctional DNA-binding transcriptional regulator/antitoxin component of YhaV-PrlF toxin-antitoxin module
MTSAVTVKGQTVVPRLLRKQYGIAPGATLDWRAEGASTRVVKLAIPDGAGNFLQALRRLGRVPAAARDRRPARSP